MPNRNIITQEHFTYSNHKTSTCNGGVGGNEDITDDEWGKVVQLEECAGFCVFLAVFSCSLKFLGWEHVAGEGLVEDFADHCALYRIIIINIWVM